MAKEYPYVMSRRCKRCFGHLCPKPLFCGRPRPHYGNRGQGCPQQKAFGHGCPKEQGTYGDKDVPSRKHPDKDVRMSR